MLATAEPFVSGGLISHRTKQPVVVIAVPTFDQRGRLAGVLAGSILLKTVGESKQALDLGYGNLQIIDRNGQLLLANLTRVANTTLLSRIRRMSSGVVLNTRGLNAQGSDVVAFATSKTADWVTVIDRPGSVVFAAAFRALALDLASVGAGVVIVLLMVFLVARRSRRETDEQDDRARSWSGLTRALMSAATPEEIADALLSSLASVFADAVVIVAFEHGDDDARQVRAVSRMHRARGIVERKEILDAVARQAVDGTRTRLLEDEPSLSGLHARGGRRLKALHSLPIIGNDGRVAGTISLLSASPRLEASEWLLLGSFAEQAANALERAWLFAREHELAVRLQQSLLPDRLPKTEGVGLAGHYLAGAEAVEVGGDWYDAVQRPDGIIQLCVGDVSGKGIGAATIMGRQRNTFHVYAHDYLSPGEIIRRMLRHVNGDEMITVACLSLDPYTGDLSYSCAGHPPPLLYDRETDAVIRLDRASAPPIGVAEAADIVEAHVRLSPNAVLAMYTDGLIERRGANIDDGIGVLAQLIATQTDVTPFGILTKIGEAIGAPDDDVALLVLTLDGQRDPIRARSTREPRVATGAPPPTADVARTPRGRSRRIEQCGTRRQRGLQQRHRARLSRRRGNDQVRLSPRNRRGCRS